MARDQQTLRYLNAVPVYQVNYIWSVFLKRFAYLKSQNHYWSLSWWEALKPHKCIVGPNRVFSIMIEPTIFQQASWGVLTSSLIFFKWCFSTWNESLLIQNLFPHFIKHDCTRKAEDASHPLMNCTAPVHLEKCLLLGFGGTRLHPPSKTPRSCDVPEETVSFCPATCYSCFVNTSCWWS